MHRSLSDRHDSTETFAHQLRAIAHHDDQIVLPSHGAGLIDQPLRRLHVRRGVRQIAAQTDRHTTGGTFGHRLSPVSSRSHDHHCLGWLFGSASIADKSISADVEPFYPGPHCIVAGDSQTGYKDGFNFRPGHPTAQNRRSNAHILGLACPYPDYDKGFQFCWAGFNVNADE